MSSYTKKNEMSSLESEKGPEYEFLTMKIGEQMLGISVNNIRDVLIQGEVTRVPLVPKEVIGLINLRGRIVTAIDIRTILKMPYMYDLANSMSVVVDYKGELYSLVVDSVGEVISFYESEMIHNPDNLSENWLEVSLGIYPINHDLVVIVDINKLLKSLDGN